MLVRATSAFLVVMVTTGCIAADVKLGAISQSSPPKLEDMKEPDGDQKVGAVGLYAKVLGDFREGTTENIYVLVNPLSNPATYNVWWVQRPVVRRADKFSCVAQLGESGQGKGEYFVIIAVATDRELWVGEKLTGIPLKMTYSKIVIVKRTD